MTSPSRARSRGWACMLSPCSSNAACPASPHPSPRLSFPSPPRKRGPIPVPSVIPAKAGTHSLRHVPPPTGIHKHISGRRRRNAANRSRPSANPDRKPRKSPTPSPVSPVKAGGHPTPPSFRRKPEPIPPAMCHRQHKSTNATTTPDAGTRRTVPFHQTTLIANMKNCATAI